MAKHEMITDEMVREGFLAADDALFDAIGERLNPTVGRAMVRAALEAALKAGA